MLGKQGASLGEDIVAESEFDINAILASVINQRIDSTIQSLSTARQRTIGKMRAKFKVGFEAYYREMAGHYGKTRSFFFRDEAEPLYSFYVPIGIRCSDTTIRTPDMKNIMSGRMHVTISGTGGSGKSVLMKHLLLNTIACSEYIPIFLELRQLNGSDDSLEQAVFQCISDYVSSLDMADFIELLRQGRVAIFLDRFDEIAIQRRDAASREIASLSKRFGTCPIVITTRPDTRTQEFGHFRHFQIMPLELWQCVDIVEKLPTDKPTKKKFVMDLKARLYQKHKTLLSNPLLLSIMLLTYRHTAEIPAKLHIFYNQAYEALFQRHDALKGAFRRSRQCPLDIRDFEKMFSAFCIQTYEDRKFDFDKSAALDYLEKSKEISGIEANCEDMFADLSQCVCLLVEDGILYGFAHRSFQEYFSARFILSCSEELRESIVNRYMAYIRIDSLIALLFEMDQRFVEERIFIPFLDKLFGDLGVKRTVSIEKYLKFIKRVWERFECENGRFVAVGLESEPWEVGSFIVDAYPAGESTGPVFGGGLSASIENIKTRSKSEGKIVVSTKSLKSTDAFVRDLYQSGHWWSVAFLNRLLEIRQTLQEKRVKSRERLDELLLQRPVKKHWI